MRVEDRRRDHGADLFTSDPAPSDGFAGDRDVPGVGSNEADQDAESRRLAGAVGAEQADDLPLIDREIEAVKGGNAAVALTEAGRLDGGGHAPEAFGSGSPVSTDRQRPSSAARHHALAGSGSASTRSNSVQAQFGQVNRSNIGSFAASSLDFHVIRVSTLPQLLALPGDAHGRSSIAGRTGRCAGIWRSQSRRTTGQPTLRPPYTMG